MGKIRIILAVLSVLSHKSLCEAESSWRRVGRRARLETASTRNDAHQGLFPTSPNGPGVRGGGIVPRRGRGISREGATSSSRDGSLVNGGNGGRRKVASVVAAVSLALLGALAYAEHGETVAEFVTSVFDVERFKSWLLRTLDDVNDRGGTLGVALYVVALALWEVVGLSTLALETSAGMAFGMKKGLPANVMGKIGGCLVAYGLGRAFLEEAVRKRFLGQRGGKYEVLDLVERSVERRPFRTALTMRASVFPTLVKNYGLAVMPSVTPGIYAASTTLYLIPFSLLWTAAGADSAARLRADGVGETLPTNRVLRVCLVLATIFMVAGSPTVLALWIRELRQDQLERKTKK